MERLFQIFDINHDLHVDFKELISGLSGIHFFFFSLIFSLLIVISKIVLCRGTIEEKLKSKYLIVFVCVILSTL